MTVPQAVEVIAVFNHSKRCFLCSGDFQRRSYIFCAAIVKDKAAQLRGANDNFLITILLFGSFVPLVTVLFVVERG